MVSVIKKVLSLLILFSAIFLSSCQEKIFTANVNCDECYTDKPDSVNLVLHFTKNSQFDTVPILIFEGNIDTGVLIDTFFCWADPANDIWVKANTYYSAKAIYKFPDKTIMVVDGTKQEVKRVSGQCDNDCWVIEGVDLKLKLAF
jgi:hypothetical protein